MSDKEKTSNYPYLFLILANSIWGLMAPLGKHAMSNGIGGFEMVSLRVLGGALSFWIASIIMSRNGTAGKTKAAASQANRGMLPPKDLLKLFGAALFAIVFNQCLYTNGLSLTSPINASLITTLLPIVTLLLSLIILKERVSWKRAAGVIIGLVGAVILISSRQQGAGKEGSLLGDLLCVMAQFSFALYLILFKKVIARYPVVTCMKWMMTFAALMILPFTFKSLLAVAWTSLTLRVYAETAWVVFGGTFFAYLFLTKGQKQLAPTVVSMYTNIQPLVSTLASLALGLGVFGWSQASAALLVIGGVYIVTHSK